MNAEFPWRLRANGECGLDDPGIFFRANHLKAGNWLARETRRNLIDALGVTNFNEMAGRIRTFNHASSDPEFVSSRWKVFGIWRDVDALDGPSTLQVSAAITQRQFKVVLHVGMGAIISTLKRE